MEGNDPVRPEDTRDQKEIKKHVELNGEKWQIIQGCLPLFVLAVLF